MQGAQAIASDTEVGATGATGATGTAGANGSNGANGSPTSPDTISVTAEALAPSLATASSLNGGQAASNAGSVATAQDFAFNMGVSVNTAADAASNAQALAQ